MLISHEIPKQLFPYHDMISDYPYVLGHLIDLDEQYKEFYKRKLQKSSFSIFDNSCFELGKSIDSEKLVILAREYKPTHLVLPDTLHDFKATIEASLQFYQRYNSTLKNNGTECIGVLQGNTFDELIRCFHKYYQAGIRFIAIPFDCIKESDWHTVRYLFFKELLKEHNSEHCKYHFLGLQNVSELLLYNQDQRDNIYSIDTSSPIINGWLGQLYSEYGMHTPKPKVKLADSLDISLNEQQIEDIIKNVKKFKQYANQ